MAIAIANWHGYTLSIDPVGLPEGVSESTAGSSASLMLLGATLSYRRPAGTFLLQPALKFCTGIDITTVSQDINVRR